MMSGGEVDAMSTNVTAHALARRLRDAFSPLGTPAASKPGVTTEVIAAALGPRDRTDGPGGGGIRPCRREARPPEASTRYGRVMSRMRHGRLTIDLPEGWSDRSTLLFVGPPPTLPTAAKRTLPQPSITMTMVKTKGEQPIDEARALLDDELAGLGAMDVGLEVLKVEDFRTAMGDGVLSTHRLTLDGVRLVQLHAVVVVGQLAVRAAASSSELEREQDMRKWLASLSMEAAS